MLWLFSEAPSFASSSLFSHGLKCTPSIFVFLLSFQPCPPLRAAHVAHLLRALLAALPSDQPSVQTKYTQTLNHSGCSLRTCASFCLPLSAHAAPSSPTPRPLTQSWRQAVGVEHGPNPGWDSCPSTCCLTAWIWTALWSMLLPFVLPTRSPRLCLFIPSFPGFLNSDKFMHPSNRQ